MTLTGGVALLGSVALGALWPEQLLAQRRCAVSEVAIVPAEVRVSIGLVISMTAMAYDEAGRPCENVTFRWNSSDVHIATVDSLGHVRGVGQGTAVITARTGTGARVKSATAVATSDVSGTVIIGDLPRGARVSIGGSVHRTRALKVPAGQHAIEIAAEGYQPYRTVVNVQPNQTHRVVVRMVALAAAESSSASAASCATAQGNLMNRANRCWDTRPLARVAPTLQLPPSCGGRATPATILVQVLATGEVGSAAAQRLSSCQDFTTLALAQVLEGFAFSPATKNGLSVTAWTRIVIFPARQ